MQHLKHKTDKDAKWYDVDVVVEVLIGEMPYGEHHAPEIANLSIGFSHLTAGKLFEELEDMRRYWPFIFPRDLATTEVLHIIDAKYPAYQELVELGKLNISDEQLELIE
jgi:hypothetical protein